MVTTMPRFPAPAGSLAAAAQAPADPSRRAMIGGAGVTALMVAGTVAAAVTPAAAIDRSAWIAAMSRYRAADAAFSHALDAHGAADERYHERRAKRPTFVMDVEGDYGRFGKHTLPITIYHEELDDLSRSWADPERIEQMRSELAAYRAADGNLRRELDLDALDDRVATASAEHSDAIAKLIATPTPDMAALEEKLIVLVRYDDDDAASSSLLADVRRLAKQEG